ncbi:MAG: SDR family oxidoreductase [Castellaniella sp.]
MNINFDRQVVLVTGGSRGIGRACALAFAQAGARVASAARHVPEAAPDHAAITPFAADLSDAAQARALIHAVEEALGPIDILVNCAGAAQRHAPATLTAQHWADAMQAKFFPYVHAMDSVLPGMVSRGRGAIVNVIGVGGKHPRPHHLPGGAANAALMLATTGLATAWAAQGVRINAINPGPTDTERVQGALQAQADTLGVSVEEARRRMLAGIPLGRPAQADEVAALALFLASDHARYITGSIIPMDGCAHPVI